MSARNRFKYDQAVLLLVFFLSGFSALIYQLAWVRTFGLVFGVTVYAVSTVLTAFMAGLAFGSYLFGKMVDRFKNAFSLFILIELGIGIFALLFPLSFKLLTAIYISVQQNFSTDFYTSSLIRFAFSFLFLLFPTTLIGGTLPVLSKIYVRRFDQLGGDMGRLYSINNLGAFLGCFAAGFILIQVLGTTSSIILAAFINLTNAGIITLISRKHITKTLDTETELTEEAEKGTKYPKIVLHIVLWVFAIEGFTTLSYEVIWTRILLGYSFDKSVYFYSTVILSFIFGLTLGSFLIAKWVDRKKDLLSLLGWMEISIGLIAVLLLPLFTKVGDYLSLIRPMYVDGWLKNLGREYFFFFIMMTLPVILMGTTFPIVAKIYTTNREKLGTKIGLIGFLDTAGSIFGAFAAGFILIPLAGVVKSAILTAALNISIGIAVLLFHPFVKRKIKMIAITSVLFSAAIALSLVPSDKFFRNWLTRQPADRLLFYDESVGSTIAVPQHLDGIKELTIDGATTADASYGDIRVHKSQGYLPLLFHENPEDILIIGMGMGVTAQSMIQSYTKQLDCVEICPAVFKAARDVFDKENKNVSAHPLFNRIIEDGRSYMLMTKKKYDIISSNGIHARLSPNIYTKEFYEICRSSLKPDGMMCQWFPSNWMSELDFKMLIKAFVEIFPHTTLWVVNASQVVLLGTPSALVIDFQNLAAGLGTDKVQQDLKVSHLNTPYSFLAQYICSENELSRYVAEVPANTDNRAQVEFSRYMNKARNPNIIWDLIDLKRGLDDCLTDLADSEEERSQIRHEIDRYYQAEKHFMIANIVNFYRDRPQDMVEELKKASELVPEYYQYHESLAIIYYRSQMFAESLLEMNRVIGLQPDIASHYENLGRLYMDSGELENAVKAFQTAIELDDGLAVSHNYLGLLYSSQKQFEKAEEHFKKAAAFYPEFIDAHYNLGILYSLQKKKQLALRSFERCEEIDPDYKDLDQWIDRTHNL